MVAVERNGYIAIPQDMKAFYLGLCTDWPNSARLKHQACENLRDGTREGTRAISIYSKEQS